MSKNEDRRFFTDDQVMIILDRYKAGGIRQKQLAEEYGVSEHTIHSIIAGRNYAHLTAPPEPELPETNPWPRASFRFREEPWTEQANCVGVDQDLFFPERGETTREAKAICAGCEVRFECLEAALARGEKFGIWGGASERERRRMRKNRRASRG